MPASDEPKQKRAKERLPADVELKLLQAIARNLREYGRPGHDLLRGLPEFERWIGVQTGDTGKKRFKRLAQQIVQPTQEGARRGRTSSTVATDHQHWAEAALNDRFADHEPRPSTCAVMRGGTPLLVDLELGAELVREAALDAERVRLIATEPDPTAPGGRAAKIPMLLLKASKSSLDAFSAQLRLAERAFSALNDSEALRELMTAADELLADHPEKQAQFRLKAREIARKHAGLSTQGAS